MNLEESVREAFDKYDTDGSGKLDLRELTLLAYDLGLFLEKDRISQVLRDLDRDKNGSVDFEEFFQWWLSEEKFPKPQEKEKHRDLRAVSEVWRKFDRDGNGYLDWTEFDRFLTAIGRTKCLDEDKYRKAKFVQTDADKDGMVSFTEWLDEFFD